MGDIQNLTDEILRDATQKAEKILADAKQTIEQKGKAAEHEAQSHRQRILNRAELDAKLITERIISGAKLKLRDQKLSAKGEVIDRVMAKVNEKIKHISTQDEVKYILADLNGRTLASGEKLIVREGMADKVKAVLPGVTVEEQAGISGFIIDRGGVIENHSLESSLDFLKEDLEAEASQILFPN